MEKLQRIDPPNCGCTDCIVGYSKPISAANEKELVKLFKGKLQNASGAEVVITWKFPSSYSRHEGSCF